MKTITEFSGTVLREAARLRREAGGTPPPAEEPVAASEGTTEEGEAAPPAEAEAAEAAPPTEGAAEPAWSGGLGVSGDRLARLLEALDAAGDRVEAVHRV